MALPIVTYSDKDLNYYLHELCEVLDEKFDIISHTCMVHPKYEAVCQ